MLLCATYILLLTPKPTAFPLGNCLPSTFNFISTLLIMMLPLELDTMSMVMIMMAILLRLSPVDSSPRLLLVTLHAGTKLDIDPRWRGEPKALAHFDEVELVDVEDTPKTV